MLVSNLCRTTWGLLNSSNQQATKILCAQQMLTKNTEKQTKEHKLCNNITV